MASSTPHAASPGSGGPESEPEVVRPLRMDEPSAGPPVHPISALFLVVVDNLWNLGDWTVIGWGITVPLSFISVFLPTLVIQKVAKKDRFGRAFALATLLGALAAVPTSLTGTPVGLAFLAWSGLSRLFGKSLPRTPGLGPRK